jgi:hypothetical protein
MLQLKLEPLLKCPNPRVLRGKLCQYHQQGSYIKDKDEGDSEFLEENHVEFLQYFDAAE